MVIIAATGNYNFFNFLTAVLALSCFDDAHLAWLLPKRVTRRVGWTGPSVGKTAAWRGWWGRGAVIVNVLGGLLGVGFVFMQTVRWFDLRVFSQGDSLWDHRFARNQISWAQTCFICLITACLQDFGAGCIFAGAIRRL